jgi:FkbM family methyltransferase
MKDYSQEGEQKIIIDYFGNQVLSFLDIGAYDGQWCSNTYQLTLNGWSGVCVEANPKVFCNLINNMDQFKKVALLNATIGLSESINQFHLADCVSSLDLEHIEQFKDLRKTVQTIYTPVITLEWIKEHMQHHFHFISVDVEGQSVELFAKAIELFSPKLICVEHEHKHAMVSDIAGASYKEIFRNGINTILERR